MHGKAPINDKWYTEPLKQISTYVALAAGVITALVAMANQLDVIDLVPAKYRSGVTAVIAGLGTVLVILHKVQGYLARNGVPGTRFDGVISPKHVHDSMVQSAITPMQIATSSVAEVGAALGMKQDGTAA